MTELDNLWPARPAWQDQAECKGLTSLFFPERGDMASIVTAAALCDSCPVQRECAAAGYNEPFGIWGGTSGRARRVAHTLSSGPTAQTHGSISRYRSGCNCSRCRAANSRREMQRRERLSTAGYGSNPQGKERTM